GQIVAGTLGPARSSPRQTATTPLVYFKRRDPSPVERSGIVGAVVFHTRRIVQDYYCRDLSRDVQRRLEPAPNEDRFSVPLYRVGQIVDAQAQSFFGSSSRRYDAGRQDHPDQYER